jgi:hypothetical protein
MASPRVEPIRVVLQTSSTILAKIDPSLDGATKKLEQQLTRADARLKDVRRVLTRLSDKRGHGRNGRRDTDLAEIVFDSPTMDTIRPRVIVYRVTIKDSRPSFQEVSRPGIEKIVNRIVETYQQKRHGQSFPETIDVRRQTRIQRGLIDTSPASAIAHR